MGQTAATTLFYGSAANPEQYVGFANRFNDLSAPNADNILDAGGTTGLASAWLIGWGESTVHGIFPKGSDSVGLTHRDLGEDDVNDSNGNAFRAYKDLFTLDQGLSVADWRYVVRIANIDVAALVAKTGTQAITAATAVYKMMAQALDHIPAIESVKAAFYVNRTIASHLRLMALDTSNSSVTIEPAINQFGKNIHQMMFLGVPVRLQDTLTLVEDRVV